MDRSKASERSSKLQWVRIPIQSLVRFHPDLPADGHKTCDSLVTTKKTKKREESLSTKECLWWPCKTYHSLESLLGEEEEVVDCKADVMAAAKELGVTRGSHAIAYLLGGLSSNNSNNHETASGSNSSSNSSTSQQRRRQPIFKIHEEVVVESDEDIGVNALMEGSTCRVTANGLCSSPCHTLPLQPHWKNLTKQTVDWVDGREKENVQRMLLSALFVANTERLKLQQVGGRKRTASAGKKVEYQTEDEEMDNVEQNVERAARPLVEQVDSPPSPPPPPPPDETQKNTPSSSTTTNKSRTTTQPLSDPDYSASSETDIETPPLHTSTPSTSTSTTTPSSSSSKHHGTIIHDRFLTPSKKKEKFPIRLHKLLCNPKHSRILTWKPGGLAWTIVDQPAFDKVFLKHFSRDASTFRRIVLAWGFHPIMEGVHEGAWFHPEFMQWNEKRCRSIRRRRPKRPFVVDRYYELLKKVTEKEVSGGTPQATSASTPRTSHDAAGVAPTATPSSTTGTTPNVETFPMKLHKALCDKHMRSAICWNPNGLSWRLVNPDKFQKRVLPTYFSGQKYKTFLRTVNIWGFCTVYYKKERGDVMEGDDEDEEEEEDSDDEFTASEDDEEDNHKNNNNKNQEGDKKKGALESYFHPYFQKRRPYLADWMYYHMPVRVGHAYHVKVHESQFFIQRGNMHLKQFPYKLRRLLNQKVDPLVKKAVCWTPSGLGWKIRNMELFKEVLQTYFQKGYDQFRHQPKDWGFTRIKTGSDRGSVFHPLFRRDDEELSRLMTAGRGNSYVHEDSHYYKAIKVSKRNLQEEGEAEEEEEEYEYEVESDSDTSTEEQESANGGAKNDEKKVEEGKEEDSDPVVQSVECASDGAEQPKTASATDATVQPTKEPLQKRKATSTGRTSLVSTLNSKRKAASSTVASATTTTSKPSSKAVEKATIPSFTHVLLKGSVVTKENGRAASNADSDGPVSPRDGESAAAGRDSTSRPAKRTRTREDPGATATPTSTSTPKPISTTAKADAATVAVPEGKAETAASEIVAAAAAAVATDTDTAATTQDSDYEDPGSRGRVTRSRTNHKRTKSTPEGDTPETSTVQQQVILKDILEQLSNLNDTMKRVESLHGRMDRMEKEMKGFKAGLVAGMKRCIRHLEDG